MRNGMRWHGPRRLGPGLHRQRFPVSRAAAAGVTHIVQTGGSKRDADVIAAADQYGMVMLHTGVRHFLH